MNTIIKKQADGYKVELTNETVTVTAGSAKYKISVIDLYTWEEWPKYYRDGAMKKFGSQFKDKSGLWGAAGTNVVRVRDIGEAVTMLTAVKKEIEASREIAAVEQTEKERLEIRVNLSTRGWGDYSPVVWTGSVETPTTEIVKQAQKLLETGHDVDNRDQTDAELTVKIENTKAAWHKKNAAAEEKTGLRENLIEKAKTTGEKQILKTYVSSECMENLSDCSFDQVTVWIDANGHETKTWNHCY